MRLNTPHLPFYLLISTLLSSILATPTIGIERDFNAQFALEDPTGVHSYSGVIEFDDKTIPADSSKMSDAQFVNLATIAYNEMVAIWKSAQLVGAVCPKAMVAFESEGYMYFASSVKSTNGVDLNAIDKDIVDSVGWFQTQCFNTDGSVHRNGGGCAEPNSIRLYGDFHPPTGNPPTYQAPPVTNTSPRMAAIVRTRGSPNTGVGKNIAPCADTTDRGYGCETLVKHYNFKPIQDINPDTNGQDDWKFSTLPNPRGQSCLAPTASDGETG